MSKVLKQTIKVALSLALLVVVFVGFALANYGFAWFAKNENVGAGGMSTSVKVSPNLIIAKDLEAITRGDLVFAVDFNGTRRNNMIAVTHDDSVENTYLKYLTNHYAVDNKTGNVKPGQTLEFAPVPEDDNEAYFIDYTVYIASAFEALTVESLKASIVMPDGVDIYHPYYYAASIDFYVNEVSTTGYRGTTSVAECLNGGTGVDLFSNQGGEVPLNTNGAIKVIMRCYFDGALQDKTTGNAYVNSYTVKSDWVVLGVGFIATEPAEAPETDENA